MTTTKCSNCGCEDSFLTSPAPCPTPAGCPTPEPCYTVTDAQCTVYTGPNIVCNTSTVISSNTTIADGLNQIVSFFCSYESTYDGPDITCNGETVVESGVTVDQAIQDLSQFYCSYEPLYTGDDITCINAVTGDTISSVVEKLGTNYCEQIQETPKAVHMTLGYSPIVSVFPWKNNTLGEAWYRNSALFIPIELFPTGKALIRLMITSEHNAGSNLRINLYEVNSATYLFNTWQSVIGTALDESAFSNIYVDFNLLAGGASANRWIELQAYIENSAQYYHIDKIDITLTPVV
jgi:hypothetical protein